MHPLNISSRRRYLWTFEVPPADGAACCARSNRNCLRKLSDCNLAWPTIAGMLLLFVVLAQAADGITLALGVPVVGIQAEQNPLARDAYAWAGIWGALGLKAVLVTIMVAVIALFGKTRRQRLILASIAGGMGLFGATANVVAIALH